MSALAPRERECTSNSIAHFKTRQQRSLEALRTRAERVLLFHDARGGSAALVRQVLQGIRRVTSAE